MAPRRFALCVLLLLPAACRDAQDLLFLGFALNREYADTHVGVSLTDGLILNVTMAGSPLLRAPCDSQAALAMHVAAFVRDHYDGFDSLQIISIAFTPQRSPEPMASSAPQLPFRFPRAAISSGLRASDSARAVESCKVWAELQ